MNHRRTPPAHMRLVRLAAPTAHDPLELLAFLMGQTPDPQPFSHTPDHNTHQHHNRGRDHPTKRSWTPH